MLLPLTRRSSLRTDEPVTERTRAALERDKMLVLRAIKELEFDRAMGKLSEKDFDEMSGRLRAARAVADEAARHGCHRVPSRDRAGTRVRVRARRSDAEGRDVSGTNEPGVCACGTPNDPDAVFCKKCGAKLLGEGAHA